jgi:lipase
MRLHVHEWGDASAPPVVCIHGLTAHGERYKPLAENELASRFHVIAPDLRGHGRSDWEPPWRAETLAADILETLAGRGIDSAVFMGHSLGGRMVLELAAAAPQRVERAILLDPAIQILPHVAFDSAEDACRAPGFDSLEAAVENRLEGEPLTPREAVEADYRLHYVQGKDGKWRARHSPAAAAALYGELATEPPDAATLRVPTLLLYAPAYGLVRDEQLETYRAALGDLLTVVEVPGGHMVMWDAYDETVAALDAFLR